ncbi:hypothetical protein [Flavobacterium sp. DSR2-3-3]|uniref:hypothetical protein n=1 Tax=Flavobacterium sp. DSR2-3-3 TaxID=2804632 RepID=UPI003CEE8837
MNNSDLIKRKNAIKEVIISFGILFIIALVTMLSLCATTPFNPVLFVPCLVISIALLPIFVIYNYINNETKGRNI